MIRISVRLKTKNKPNNNNKRMQTLKSRYKSLKVCGRNILLAIVRIRRSSPPRYQIWRNEQIKWNQNSLHSKHKSEMQKNVRNNHTKYEYTMGTVFIIILIVIATILMLVELFIIPGTSFAGILSFCCYAFTIYYAFSLFGAVGDLGLELNPPSNPLLTKKDCPVTSSRPRLLHCYDSISEQTQI